MIIETCGPRDEILKLLPPLTIDKLDLSRGLAIIDAAISASRGIEVTRHLEPRHADMEREHA